MTSKPYTPPSPRATFERRIFHQFGVTPAIVRAIAELHYPKAD